MRHHRSMTLRDSIGPSAADLRVVYAALVPPIARLAIRFGEMDPDIAEASLALNALHELLAARERAERGE